MTNKFQNKYRTTSTRLQHYDYGQNGAYFVTICSKDKKCFFGEIIDGEMILSPLGSVANVLWYEIQNHAKNIELGSFVVMPNHVHGILILQGINDDECRDKACLVSTNSLNNSLNPNNKTIGQQRFQNQGKNTISSIVGGYKSTVTKHLHRLNFQFAWQPRFYDHIIRNEKSYQKINEYIINNPLNWQKDELYQ